MATELFFVSLTGAEAKVHSSECGDVELWMPGVSGKPTAKSYRTVKEARTKNPGAVLCGKCLP